ncbi:MAG: aminotransferase class IV [Deltaproteobacteria bacterium]|nr:aminotransferase class IV [Candidatus Tharpella aukensis]
MTSLSYRSKIYINDRLVPENEAAISPLDTGFLFGDGLFETIRTYVGKPFQLDEHLARLRRGLQKLALPEPHDLKQSPAIITELLAANRLSHDPGVIKLVVSRGNPETDNPNHTSTLMIRASTLDVESIKCRQQGMRALILPWRRDRHNPLLAVKSINYLENRYGLQEARRKGFDEGIFLNQEGELCEGSFSNLFLIRNNSLLTPPLAAGLLPGITRNFILKIANQLSLGCREMPLSPKDLGECDGAFLTSSLMEIAPLIELDEYKFDVNQTATTRNLLQEAFRKETAE